MRLGVLSDPTEKENVRPVGWSRIGVLGGVLVAGTLLAGCSSPTEGPTIRITDTGWTAIPETMVQPGDQFELTLVNETNLPVNFVVVGIFSGEVTDIPTVKGMVVDLTQGPVDELSNTPPPPGLIHNIIHPDPEAIAAARYPSPIAPGEERKVVVGGSFGMGGGEPGIYAAISNEPGGLERGDFAVFELLPAGGSAIDAVLKEAAAGVYLILPEYTVEEVTGECSGSGELSAVVEGSQVFLLDADFVGHFTEGVPIVLPTGTEIVKGEDPDYLQYPSEENTGCLFELGNPLGMTPAEYGASNFHHESNPLIEGSGEIEGDRVIVIMVRETG